MTRPRALRATALTVTAVAALALTGCGGKQERDAAAGADTSSCTASAGQISIATGNSTGVYYVLGGGIASMLSKDTPLKATASETGASVQNIEQLVAGEHDVAFSLADTAADAVAGTGAFPTKQPVQALGRTHSNFTQVVVRSDSGITSLADMKGKRISTGSPKSGTEVIATRLLDTAGLDIDTDIKAQRLEIGKTVDAIKDGSIDGLFWSGGLPTPALTDLFTSQKGNVEFLDVTPQLEAMQKVNAVYEKGAIPAATYGTPADVPTIVVPNVLLVRDDFPANDACAITTEVWSRTDELAKVHPAAKQITLENGVKTDPVPLAPGAQRAFEAMG